MSITKNIRPWIIWIIPTMFCVVQFVLRLFPGHIQIQLMNNFNIGANDFGTFSAAYYLGYAGFQIPVAILLEKYRPQIVIALSAFICALGCFIMAYTKDWNVAILSRFIIGTGSVAGLLGTTKVVLDWFQPKNHAKMISVSMSIGVLGAIYGGKPISLLITKFSWQNTLIVLGLVVCIIGILAFFIVKKNHVNVNNNENLISNNFSWLEQIKSLLKQKTFIMLAIANFLMVGCLEGFADVWGVGYLSLAVNITTAEASLLTSLVFVGVTVGMPILSIIADRFNAYRLITAFCGILMSLSLALLLLFPGEFSTLGLKALMIFIGILSGYQALVFVMGERLVPKIVGNTAIATLNCINMLGGAFFHKTIGIFTDLAAGNNNLTNSSNYTLSDYSIGLAIIPILSFIGGILLLTEKRKIKILDKK